MTSGDRYVVTMVLCRVGCVRRGGFATLRGRCLWLSVRQGGQEPAGTDSMADRVVPVPAVRISRKNVTRPDGYGR